MAFATEAAVLNSTGAVYLANAVRVGVFNPLAQTITSTIPLPVQGLGNPSLNVVNQATGFIYVRYGSVIAAVNTGANVIATTLRIGGEIQSFALDQTRNRLYVTYNTPGFAQNMAQQSGIAVIEDRKSTRLNSSHIQKSRMPSSA